jgi:hypothetical protein
MDESDQMQKLLLAINEEHSGVRLSLIGCRQERLNAAHGRYHIVREQYIRDVLETDT